MKASQYNTQRLEIREQQAEGLITLQEMQAAVDAVTFAQEKRKARWYEELSF